VSDDLCAAALPVFAGATGHMAGDSPIFDHIAHAWRECGMPAVAVGEYRCACGHEKRRANCGEHEPEPGAVGCRQCWDEGHECEMAVRAVTGDG